jgi:hypothetical protein
MVIAAVAKKGAPALPDLSRRLDPTGSLQIKVPKSLQFPVLFFRKEFNAHGICHIYSGIHWFIFLPGIQRGFIVTQAPAPAGAFR